MKREIKKPEIRRNEIITTAQRLFFQKGFERTSIQDIIDELGIAKGTFYYYFTSKLDLLDQLMDMLSDQMAAALTPVITSDLPAIDKFNQLFRDGMAFKVAQKEAFIIMLRVMFKDDNTIIKDKMYCRMVEKNTPLFAAIIKQGTKEGTFNTNSPDDVAELLLNMGRNLNESICRLVLRTDIATEKIAEIIMHKINVYQSAMERMLGAPTGSLKLYATENFADVVKTFRAPVDSENHLSPDELYKRGY